MAPMGPSQPNSTPSVEDLDSSWNASEPAASEAKFRDLFKATEQLSSLYGHDASAAIEILTQIARAEGAQKKFVEAQATLSQAERMLQSEQSSYQVSSKIRWLLEKGRLHLLQKTPSQARPLFVQAWTLASHSGEDFFAVDAAIMMAASEPPKLQQDWLVKAIKLAEESPQPKAKSFLGSLYASLGWKLFDLRQFEPALEIFQKSLSHFNEHGTAKETFVAKWSIGKLLRMTGKTDKALQVQNSLLVELGIGGQKDGRLYEELAECLHALKRSEEAQRYFELAYRELSADEWIADNQPAMLKRLKDLGKVK